MDNNCWEALNVFFASVKTKINDEAVKAIRKEYQELLLANAQARRIAKAEDIKTLASLRIALMKFEQTYRELEFTSGKIPILEDEMRKLRHSISIAVLKKNLS